MGHSFIVGHGGGWVWSFMADGRGTSAVAAGAVVSCDPLAFGVRLLRVTRDSLGTWRKHSGADWWSSLATGREPFRPAASSVVIRGPAAPGVRVHTSIRWELAPASTPLLAHDPVRAWSLGPCPPRTPEVDAANASPTGCGHWVRT